MLQPCEPRHRAGGHHHRALLNLNHQASIVLDVADHALAQRGLHGVTGREPFVHATIVRQLPFALPPRLSAFARIRE